MIGTEEKKTYSPEEIAAAMAEIQCEELKKIEGLYPEINFEEIVSADPAIA